MGSLVGLCMAAAAFVPVPVFGAEPSAAASLEEIVVTARRREESLQRVPVSVTAISAVEVEKRSITTLDEVGQYTPNLFIGNQGQNGKSASMVYIRGIGQTDATITNDPGVGVYIDGVYLGRMQGLDLDMMDLERIEILRGPQGTLFGKNTIGGAISVVSAKPTNEFGGRVRITAGRFDRIDGVANFNVPIVEDKFAVRLAGSTRNQSGYGQSLQTGERFGNSNSLSGRAVFSFTPNQDLEILAAVDGTRIREQSAAIDVEVGQADLVQLVNLFADPPYDERWETPGIYTNYSDGPNLNDADHWGTSLKVSWDTGPVTVKSITSYRNNETIYGTDFDGSPIDLVDHTAYLDQDQFSQELQLSGNSFDSRLDWVFGLYYFTEDAHQTYTDTIAFPIKDPLGVDLSFVIDVKTKNNSYAAYGQGTYSITDKLSATAGLRYTYDKKEGEMFQFSPFTGATLVPFTSKKDNWDAVSPRLSFEYQWKPDLMTYVSVAQGFKSGGFNGLATSAAAFTSYDPEKVWTYEAGFRSDLMDKKVRFNATAFFSSYRDIQFTVIKGGADGRPTTEVGNAGKAEIKGFELELVTVPVKGLTINGGLGYTDAEYTSVDPSALVTLDSKFVRTPKWVATISGEYTVPIQTHFNLTTRVDYAYKSKVYHDAANSSVGIQKAYGILNARLTLASQDNVWGVSVFGTNLTNEKYLLSALDFRDSLGLATREYAAPREWGVNLEYRF